MLVFDFSDFKRAARRMGALADQIPFALARSLNDGAEIAMKKNLPQAWAEHITVRNPRFLQAALSTRYARATKRNLSVIVYDRLGRGSLSLHDKGGTKRPRGVALAVPNKANVQPLRTGKGVPMGSRPRNIPQSFKTKGKYGTDIIVQRTGTYTKASEGSKAVDNRKIKIMYGLQSSAPICADVPFEKTFNMTMRREVKRAFSHRIKQAMATARKVR